MQSQIDASAGAGTQGLTEYLALLKRRWWVVAEAATLFVALAAMLVIIVPESYSSFVMVNVTPTGVDRSGQSGRNNLEINLQTESQRVRSMSVSSVAAKIMKSKESPGALAKKVTVTVPNDSTILYLTCTAATAVQARDCAHAFGEAYLKSRSDSALAVINTEVSSLTNQMSNLTKEWSAQKDQAQKDLLYGQLQALGEQLSSARITAANITPGEIITDAALPTEPANPSPRKYLPSGLALGLLLGVIAAIVLEKLDRRVHTPGDVERKAGLQVLLNLRKRRKRGPLGLLSARDPEGQAFHRLGHSISAALQTERPVVMFTGASRGSGNGVVTANAVAALARTGLQTMVICADLDAGSCHRHLGLADGPGLAELLLDLDGTPVKSVARQPAKLPRLAVIGPGLDTTAAADLVQGPRLAELIAKVRERADLVVIEAPSPSEGADAQSIADLCDATLIVVESRKTRVEQIREAVGQIDRMGSRLLGAIIVPAQGTRKHAPAAGLPASTPQKAGKPAATDDVELSDAS